MLPIFRPVAGLHTLGILTNANPTKYGIEHVVVWSRTITLDKIENKHGW